MDDNGTYEKILGGTWAPWPLAGDTAFQPGDLSVRPTILGTKISEIQSILFVFTPDKSKWSRCPVLEEQSNPNLTTPISTAKLHMRQVASLDKNGFTSGMPGYNSNEGDLVSSQNMSWFPGYAIDLESGERLNVAFGEDSFWGGTEGRDMIWNPSDQLLTNQGTPIMGGGHWIYVFKNYRRQKGDANQMPGYDDGQFMHDRLATGLGADMSKVFRACSWVGSGLIIPGSSLLSMQDGLIPSEVELRLNVNKPYFLYVPYPGAPDPQIDVARNAGLPLYTFHSGSAATQTNVHDVAVSELDQIGVVPNPYYAFSGYESSRLDNRVKFINLPVSCTISIYNVSGSLVRKYHKDNDLTYLDWDLKNSYNVPIAGGTYICHIEVPDVGEKVIKWFGVIRPVDLQNF